MQIPRECHKAKNWNLKPDFLTFAILLCTKIVAKELRAERVRTFSVFLSKASQARPAKMFLQTVGKPVSLIYLSYFLSLHHHHHGLHHQEPHPHRTLCLDPRLCCKRVPRPPGQAQLHHKRRLHQWHTVCSKNLLGSAISHEFNDMVMVQ